MSIFAAIQRLRRVILLKTPGVGFLYRSSMVRYLSAVILMLQWSSESSVFAQRFEDIPPMPPVSSIAEGTGDPHSAAQLFIGSLSCSASSCHGNPRRETVVSSSAQYFFDRDKHQLAGTVLHNQRSRDMTARLKLTTQPWETRDCLICHAPGALSPAEGIDRSAMISEGVGCESCHGSARDWLVSHRSVEWHRSWSSSQKAQSGFVETKELSLRIDRCADCHVGNATQSVNHDLIAAGHPRLAFEFAAYQSRMPIHWRQFQERQRSPVAANEGSFNRSTLEARNWLIGQIVNAEHELEILSAAANKNLTESNSQPAWPDLAQYDCFACHHELSSPSWRQARGAWNLRPGELPWGTWNLGLIAEVQPAIPGILSKQIVSDLTSLRDLMRSTSPNPANTLLHVANLRRELANSKSVLTNTRFQPQELGGIRDLLLAQHETVSRQGWDRATQLFLGTIALDKGVNDASGSGNRINPAGTASLERLKVLLSYPRTSKVIPPFPHAESPTRLDVNGMAEIRSEFKRLQSTLSKPDGSAATGESTDNVPPVPTVPALGTD